MKAVAVADAVVLVGHEVAERASNCRSMSAASVRAPRPRPGCVVTSCDFLAVDPDVAAVAQTFEVLCAAANAGAGAGHVRIFG